MGATPTNKNPHMTTPTASSGAGSGTDDDAIHDNVAAEISAITSKATPTSADLLLIEDAADSNNKKKITLAEILALIPRALSSYLSVVGTDIVQGDGAAYLPIPSFLAGKKVIRAQVHVVGTPGSGGGVNTFQVHNLRLGDNILSTAISLTDSGTLATPGVVDATKNTLQADDVLRVDVDSISAVAPDGVIIVLETD